MHRLTRRQIEGKYTDAATGMPFDFVLHASPSPGPRSKKKKKLLSWTVFIPSSRNPRSHSGISLNYRLKTGVVLTETWTTANSLDTKLELDNQIAKGLKLELLGNYGPANKTYGAKSNIYFKQPNVHARAFVDLLKGPTATVDVAVGHEGFLAGAETTYDVQKAAVTRYSAAVGYQLPGVYAATINASNNMSVFAASYYHKVNSQVEAGAKAVWDSKAGNNVGLEVASKYRLDPASFAKVSRRNTLQCQLLTIRRPRSTTRALRPLPTTSSSAPA